MPAKRVTKKAQNNKMPQNKAHHVLSHSPNVNEHQHRHDERIASRANIPVNDLSLFISLNNVQGLTMTFIPFNSHLKIQRTLMVMKDASTFNENKI